LLTSPPEIALSLPLLLMVVHHQLDFWGLTLTTFLSSRVFLQWRFIHWLLKTLFITLLRPSALTKLARKQCLGPNTSTLRLMILLSILNLNLLGRYKICKSKVPLSIFYPNLKNTQYVFFMGRNVFALHLTSPSN